MKSSIKQKMQELWIKNNKLIPEKEWIKLISNLKSKDRFKNKQKVKKELREKLIRSVRERIPKKKFGIFFSGGVDSSLIAILCRKLKADFICYVVGFQDEKTKEPADITEAKKVAKKFGFKLRYKVYNLKEAEKIIKKTVKILKPVKKTDVVNVGVGAVVVAAIELAKKDKIDYFLGGLGSEEIFAGYERHKVEDINKECWIGLRGMWQRDLVRDFNLAKDNKLEINTPFLDEELIKFAMKIPSKWKLNKKYKKVILREVAEEFLGTFAWRKKKAAQYGSCFDKAISKLAKQKEFKLKKEYLAEL